MNMLITKIWSTFLFDDREKTAIIDEIGQLSQPELSRLENIIDTFDTTYRQSVANYKRSVFGKLNALTGNETTTQSVRKMQKGLSMLLT